MSITVKDIADRLELYPINECNTERIVGGCYIGDLLSHVMVNASKNDVWITIMTNVNVAAVAVVADISMIVLAENSVPDSLFIKKVREHGINLYSTKLSAYELAVRIGRLL